MRSSLVSLKVSTRPCSSHARHVTQLDREIQPQNVKLTVNQNQHVFSSDPPAGSDETVGGTGGGTSAPAFPRVGKAESEEGNLWLRGRRLIRSEKHLE